MVKSINHKKLIFVSLLLAILIFISGILIGITLDELRTNDLTTFLNENELQTESYLVERQFLEAFGGDNCDLIKPRIQDLSENLGDIGTILTKYEAKGLFSGDKYSNLKNQYFLREIKLYTLLKEVSGICPSEEGTTILYFYDQNHQASLRQGYVLDSLVDNYNVTVLSIDRTFEKEDPLVTTLKKHYNITSSPTLIVNFNNKFEGIMSLNELKQLIKDE